MSGGKLGAYIRDENCSLLAFTFFSWAPASGHCQRQDAGGYICIVSILNGWFKKSYVCLTTSVSNKAAEHW